MASIELNDRLQYFITTADEILHRVTENTAWDPSVDQETYDASYKDRVSQPTYVTGSKYSVEIDIDHIDGSTVQDFLYDIEDDANVAVTMVRVDRFRPGTAPGSYAAKQCELAITMNPLDAEAGGPVHHTGTATRTSEGWVKGTFVPDATWATGVFTPDA